MTIQERIYAQLSNTKKDIKLSKIDELENSVEEAEVIRENWDESLTIWYQKLFDLRDEFTEIKNFYNDFMSRVDVIKTDLESVKSDLNDLGIDANNIPYTNDIEAFLRRSDDVYAEMIEANSSFSKIDTI